MDTQPIVGPTMPGATPGSDSLSPAFAAALGSSTGATVTGSSGGTSYAQQVTPTSAVVTSSSPFQAVVDNTKSNISGLPGTVTPPAPSPTGSTGAPTTYTWTDGTQGHLTPDVNGFGTIGYNAATDTANKPDNSAIETQRQALQTRRDQEIASLKVQQGQDTTALTTTQDNETGGSTRNLLAMGGYLGNNSFAGSYLSSLQVSHEQAMQTLNAKYQSAIQAANNAFSDNDFKLAQQEVQNAKDIQKAAQDRNTAFLDETNKIQDNIRADAAQKFQEQQVVIKANTDNLTWARTNGLHPGAQFFESGGQIYNAQDGSSAGSTLDQLKANGVDIDKLSNVQQISAKRTGTLGEMDDYNQGLVQAGKSPLNIMQYTDMVQKQKVAIAAAGRAITNVSVAEKQFDLTQEQTQALAATIKAWKDSGYIQGNGTIDAKDYKVAKTGFISKYGADAGKAFDLAMTTLVDSSNQGGTKQDQATGVSTSIPNYKTDYGITQ